MERLSKDILENIKPVVWLPKENADRLLIDVLFEATMDYFIVWYHWPKDGYAFTNLHEDFEPVILVVRKSRVVDIGIRPHNSYRHSKEWLEIRGKPIVLFRTAWHEPVIYNGQPSASFFTNSRFSDLMADYSIKEGKPPPWFIKADANMSVYEYAEALAGGGHS